MRGPFLPLYGTGAIMMLVVTIPFKGNLVLTYLAGCVGATVLEYVTGVLMEALFKVRYWDYSNKKFNFQGHICLSSTLAWGFLTILMTEVVHKPIEQLAFMIPGMGMNIATFLLTIYIAGDFAVSFRAALDLRDVLSKLEKVKEEIEHMQKRLDVLIALKEDDVKEELAELRVKYLSKIEINNNLKEFRAKYMKGILLGNPGMVSKKFTESLEELKDAVNERLKKD